MKQPDKENASHLWDMLSAAREVVLYTKDMSFDDYAKDRKTRLVIERLFEIIGEAANNVSKDLRDIHSQIQWTKIIRHRNVLVHEYGEVRHDLIWHVVTHHIPELIELLVPIVPDPK